MIRLCKPSWRHFSTSTKAGSRSNVVSHRLNSVARLSRSAHDPEEVAALQKWLATHQGPYLPQKLCTVTFSRSSGPGGQNVNKTNSKATLKLPLASLEAILPPLLHRELRTSRYFAPRGDSLVIHSDSSRKQSENREACYSKVEELMRDMIHDLVPRGASQAQRQRVQDLKAQETEGRMRIKKHHSAKKSARRSVD